MSGIGRRAGKRPEASSEVSWLGRLTMNLGQLGSFASPTIASRSSSAAPRENPERGRSPSPGQEPVHRTALVGPRAFAHRPALFRCYAKLPAPSRESEHARDDERAGARLCLLRLRFRGRDAGIELEPVGGRSEPSPCRVRYRSRPPFPRPSDVPGSPLNRGSRTSRRHRARSRTLRRRAVKR